MTVAHALDPGDEIIPFESDKASEAYEIIVGKCRKTFRMLKQQNGGKLTADLALLELDTGRCSVDNTITWTGRRLRLKIYKGETIPHDDHSVIVLDQYGKFQKGRISEEGLTDKQITDYAEGLHDVLGICADHASTKRKKTRTKRKCITEKGDSGALVMSRPNTQTDFVYVYGIVIGTYSIGKDESLTIANTLRKVIPGVFHDRQEVDFA